jgi:hypothetical protein
VVHLIRRREDVQTLNNQELVPEYLEAVKGS